MGHRVFLNVGQGSNARDPPHVLYGRKKVLVVVRSKINCCNIYGLRKLWIFTSVMNNNNKD